MPTRSVPNLEWLKGLCRCGRGVIGCFAPRTTRFFCGQAHVSYHLICIECVRKVGDPLSSSLAVLQVIHPLLVPLPTDISF